MSNNRSLVNITRDLISARYDVEIWENEEAIDLVDDLIKERFSKENGMQYLYGEMEGEIALFTKQKKRMEQYIKFLKNSQERLKTYVIEMYDITDNLPRCDVFNPIKISESAGSVDVIDESAIPQEYFIEIIESRLDKKRILKELKEGTKIPGVRLHKKPYVRGIK